LLKASLGLDVLLVLELLSALVVLSVLELSDLCDVWERRSDSTLEASVVSPEVKSLLRAVSACSSGLPFVAPPPPELEPPSGGLGGGLSVTYFCSEVTRLCALLVSPDAIALLISLRYLVIGSVPLAELELLSVPVDPPAALGAFDNRPLSVLAASVVSPEDKSLSSEVKACWSGLDDLDLVEELAALS
jgi:hypothetical protein